MNFNVVVIGGGASGSAAGIQSARLGARTLIIEETPWLGGMITSAGVSAFDGNKYALGGGIFGELRKKIEDHYGGADKTFTGWISLTCFEPKIGKEFLTEIAEKEENLTVWYSCKLISVEKSANKIKSIKVEKRNKEIETLYADVFIEATEWGDVLGIAEVSYRLGRDIKSDTLEESAPSEKDFELQDMTFCAILKKYEGEAPKVHPSPEYDPNEFINSTAGHCSTTDENYLNHKLHDWDSFITYAALPNDKYLLNWPFRSNDYYTIAEIYEKPETRPYHFKKAKERTLNYIHYMQTKLGHPEWGLATNEYPTEDFLPFIPYVRESRRVKGIYLMVEGDVVPAVNSYRPRLQKQSIAVGDYFLDHHHSTFFKEPDIRLVEKLPANAPFQIPMTSLIPAETDGLIVAEKSISVSHIVNGCTRLQPVVMLIGQAAGALAAIAVREKIEIRDVKVVEVQKELIRAGCQLFPYKDIWNTNPIFQAVQELALEGIYPDRSDFTFAEDGIISESELILFKEKFNSEIIIQELYSLSREKRGLVYLKMYEKHLSLL